MDFELGYGYLGGVLAFWKFDKEGFPTFNGHILNIDDHYDKFEIYYCSFFERWVLHYTDSFRLYSEVSPTPHKGILVLPPAKKWFMNFEGTFKSKRNETFFHLLEQLHLHFQLRVCFCIPSKIRLVKRKQKQTIWKMQATLALVSRRIKRPLPKEMVEHIFGFLQIVLPPPS